MTFMLAVLLASQFASIGQLPPTRGAGSDVAAVRATINALVAGVVAHDGAAVLATIRPEGKATVGVEKPDGSYAVRHPSWEEFVGGIKPGPQKFEPRFSKPVIEVDGNIAVAWTPYVYFIDGKFHHCGANHFDLTREADGWKILNVTYSYRTIGCPKVEWPVRHAHG